MTHKRTPKPEAPKPQPLTGRGREGETLVSSRWKEAAQDMQAEINRLRAEVADLRRQLAQARNSGRCFGPGESF